tara:strand:- start:41 stop:223 length:183 start_codon:yes stop_codon:yes gene_type:complete
MNSVIKELSSEGIANVIRDQADILITGYSMPRKDLEIFSQKLIDDDIVDEIYFIIELESE